VASEGTTVLVTTHYMDEAERCHRLAFIFRGEVLAIGTPEEVVASRGLSVVEVECDDSVRAADVLRLHPEVDEVTFMGGSMRVALTGVSDAEAWASRVLADAELRPTAVRPARASVEDAFVSMVRAEQRQHGVDGSST
jgi:ABC-2 type transport system ATP-binding protein